MKCFSTAWPLSASVMLLVTAPAFSGALSSNPVHDGQPVVYILAQNDVSRNTPDDIAQATPDHYRADAGTPDEFAASGFSRFGQPMPGLHLAARLAVAETYVGITSGQLDVWRAYASALIEFADLPEVARRPERPRGGPPHARGDGSPPSVDARPAPVDEPLLTERVVGGVIERGEKAVVLKGALSALRATLAPEQLSRLRKAERSLLPSPGLPTLMAPGRSHPDFDRRRHIDMPVPPPLPPFSGE